MNACPVRPFLRNCPLLVSATRAQPDCGVPALPAGPRSRSDRFPVYPAAIWLVVLTAIFATEYAVMLALPWILPPSPDPLWEAAVDGATLILVLAPLIWWTVVRPLREINRLRTRFLTDLFSRIESDRRGTAYELHDGVGQSLSLLVSGLRSALESASKPEAEARAEHLLKLAQDALKDVKRVALGLRPSLLDDLGLAPALERLAADVREHHAIDLKLDVSSVTETRFSEPVETAMFRIVQEALANAVAHSGATAVAVSVRKSDDHLSATVADDGCGFDPSKRKKQAGGHLGLIGMRERARLLGGEFGVQSTPGRGTRVTASIPIGG